MKIDYNESCFAIDLPTPDKDSWKEIWTFFKKEWDSLFFPIKIKWTLFLLGELAVYLNITLIYLWSLW